MPHENLRDKSVPPQRYGKPVRFATAGTAAHEYGGSFAPELELECRVGPQCRICPGQRHQQTGWTTGELGRLVEIRRLRLVPGRHGIKPPLQAQGGAAVAVIRLVPPELAIAGLPVERDGSGVVLMPLEPQRRAIPG